MRTQVIQHATAGVLLSVTLAACSGSAPSPSATPVKAHPAAPTKSATPSPSFTGSPLEQADAKAALAAYEDEWADVAAVEDDGNYQDPRLEQQLAGNLLLTTSEILYEAEQLGIASRGAPILHAHVTSVDASGRPPTATIDDCIDTHDFVQFWAKTGKPYEAPATGDLADAATVTLMNGSWMVTANNEEFGTPCTP